MSNMVLRWKLRWESECAEWQAIKDELLATRSSVTAHDVSAEQLRRMRERREKPITYQAMVAEAGARP